MVSLPGVAWLPGAITSRTIPPPSRAKIEAVLVAIWNWGASTTARVLNSLGMSWEYSGKLPCTNWETSSMSFR